jgi:hypothetical protein
VSNEPRLSHMGRDTLLLLHTRTHARSPDRTTTPLPQLSDHPRRSRAARGMQPHIPPTSCSGTAQPRDDPHPGQHPWHGGPNKPRGAPYARAVTAAEPGATALGRGSPLRGRLVQIRPGGEHGHLQSMHRQRKGFKGAWAVCGSLMCQEDCTAAAPLEQRRRCWRRPLRAAR